MTRKMLNWLGGGRKGAVSLSESVINNNTNLQLLQTDGCGTNPGVCLMYFSMLTCRVGPAVSGFTFYCILITPPLSSAIRTININGVAVSLC